MPKRHWRDSIKALGNHINPEQDEQVKKTKIGIHFFSKQPQPLQYYWRLWDRPIENKCKRYKTLSLQVPLQFRPQQRHPWFVLPECDLNDRVLTLMKLIERESQRKKVEGPVFQKKYQTHYPLYEHLNGHVLENIYVKENTDTSSSMSSLSSFCSSSELESYNSFQQLEELKGECARLSRSLDEKEVQLCTQNMEIKVLSMETKELGEQNDGLRELILELERTSKQKEEDLSGLLIKLDENEAALMSKYEDLIERANDLRIETDAWSEKEIVYQEGEIVHMLSPRESKSQPSLFKGFGESSDFLLQIGFLKEKFERKNLLLQKIVEEKRGLERKVKEMEHQMESIELKNEGLHIRVYNLEESLTGRNYDAFVLQKEFEGMKNDSCTQIKALEEEISSLQERLKTKEEHYRNIMRSKEEVINKLIDEKRLTKTKYYKSKLKRIEKTAEEVQKRFERSMVSTKNRQFSNNEVIREVEANLDILHGEAVRKDAEIVGLNERIWKLENDMMDLGEGKREAIRQLCVSVDYHRSQNNYLKKILSGLHMLN